MLKTALFNASASLLKDKVAIHIILYLQNLYKALYLFCFFQDVLEAQCGIVQHHENLLWNSFLMLFNSLNEQPKVSSMGFTTQHYMLCQCLFIGKTSVFSSGDTNS